MTVAICIRCGEFKHGAFTACRCGFVPETDDDLLVSLAASDHNMSIEQLKTLSQQVKYGAVLKPTSADRERLAEVLQHLRQMLPSRSAAQAEPLAPEVPEKKTSPRSDKRGSEVPALTLVRLMFSFKGRIGRAAFLCGSILQWSPVLLVLVMVALRGASPAQSDLSIAGMSIVILSAPMVLVGLALKIKRLHDLDVSGWLLLVLAALGATAASQEAFVALLYLAFELWLLVAKGTSGPNDYGASTMRRQHRVKLPSAAARADKQSFGASRAAVIAAVAVSLPVFGWMGAYKVGVQVVPVWWPFAEADKSAGIPTTDDREVSARGAVLNDPTVTQATAEAEQQRFAALSTGQRARNDDLAPAVIPGSGASFHDQLLDGKPCPFCPEMVLVPAGTFKMGLTDDEPVGRRSWVKSVGSPQVDVSIARSFAVGQFSVTFDEWDACVADGGCNGYRPSDEDWGRGRRPVIHVNWNDAKAYAAWLSKKTGKPYRLLSETEREYVTRAGTATPFWWGSAITPNEANYNSIYVYAGGGSKGEYRKRTVPVDSFRPNPWGLYQVHGNVWEWTEDCWNDSNVGNPGDGSARQTGDCSLRVVRGGCLLSYPETLRSSWRAGYSAADGRHYFYQGFRVARALSP